MNITVCIKQVPGTSEVEIDEKTGNLIREGIDSKMNPFDLHAIETALKIKEQEDSEISVISMGPPQALDIIKEAYMLGVDNGYLLTDRKFAGADVLATAYALSQGIEQMKKYDLIICGKMTTDGDTAQVGPEIAEFLDIPHVANVKKILDINSKSITVEMDMPETVEIQKVTLPCLITVEKEICQPRLPSYKLKLATSKRKIEQITFDDLKDNDATNFGLDGSPTQVLDIFPPTSDKTSEKWEGNGKELGKKFANKLKEMKFV